MPCCRLTSTVLVNNNNQPNNSSSNDLNDLNRTLILLKMNQDGLLSWCKDVLKLDGIYIGEHPQIAQGLGEEVDGGVGLDIGFAADNCDLR